VITGFAAAVIASGFASQSSLVPLVIAGLPIAFLGGRALLPTARSGGWLEAFAVGLIFGLIAPPLGAIEVILVGLLALPGGTTGLDAGYLVLLPIVLVFSYVVAFMTVPAGLIWALIVRAIPNDVLVSMDLSRCLRPARLAGSISGLRHRRTRSIDESRDPESRFVAYGGRNSRYGPKARL
jgi:hypothetical protein